MATDEQYEELQRLVVALTNRVDKLEEIAGVRRSEVDDLRPRIRSHRDPPSKTVRPHSQIELESRIGGHWLNRVGIFAVLIGVSYFLKYAFDNDWIGPAARIVIGLASGFAMVFWSEPVRRGGYEMFSYSLKAIGIGVVYLSLWASSQLYQLIPNTLALFSMISVTSATVGLALWHDSEVIAGFAAIGAFITPVALSTGVNNAAALFTYLFILDIGALILVRYRPWGRVLLGAYVATLLLYSSWHSRYYATDQFSIALTSVSLLFVPFAIVPFVATRVRTLFAISLLALLNAATYFFEVWELFEHEAQSHQAALAAVGLACLYFLLAYQLRHLAAVTTDVHWAIGAAFLIAAVPIGVHAPWISVGWFVEGAALIRASRRTKTNYLKLLGGLALVLGTARLLAIDHFDVTQLLLNERLMTFGIALAALADVARTLSATRGGADKYVLAIVIVAINILALLALTQEITDAWRRHLLDVQQAGADRSLRIVRDFAYSALWMSYGAGLMLVGFWKRTQFLRWQALILIGITVGKVFIYDTSLLDRGYRIFSLIALGLLLLATSFLYQRSTRISSRSST
jgi:uncharacterized membrane protein